MASSAKKSFDFRMSKKVAELTQVVHMLFTRNHEKEVEMEALKDAYEHEIQLVINDARDRIEKLESLNKELERQRIGDSEKHRHLFEAEMTQRENVLKLQITKLDRELQNEKNECQNVRDLLIHAQNDIEKLRRGQTEEFTRKTEELERRNKEIEKLKINIANLEKQVKDHNSHSTGRIGELQRSNEKLQKELSKIKETLEDVQKTKDQLIARNRQLEMDIKNFRRELSKRSSEGSRSSSTAGRQETVQLSSAAFMDYNEEIEKLRREVQRYKMELSNREGNFNRMFTDKQPVLISRGGAKLQQNGHISPQLRYHREKTIAAYPLLRAEDDEWQDIVPPRSASSTGRLPQLGMDQKSRLQKLLRPKPLPKDWLYERASAP